MEVGAVKQAFNNEVIQLKKKLDQAKTQIINKLTRKAKTLTQKKAPDHLADKLKRKATSAVNDVMAIKKINNKDLAKFAITHSGKLNDFLNKPTSSSVDRACARLLLHKALQDKYQLLRSRFTNVPIEDLLMSRLERQKLKKEEQEKRKLKKKEKEDRKRKRERDSEKNNAKIPIQAEGDWSVEDIDLDELILNKKFVPKVKDKEVSDDDNDGSEEHSDNEKALTAKGKVFKMPNNFDSVSGDELDTEKVGSNDEDLNACDDEIDNDHELNNSTDDENVEQESEPESNKDNNDEATIQDSDSESDKESENGEETKLSDLPQKDAKCNSKIEKTKLAKSANKKPVKEDNRKKLPKLSKNKSKTKNFSDKMQSKKSKIVTNDLDAHQSNKIVDPFFITATGENYMSLAEPRGPDEVKEVHRQGNRQMRRAAMFGHVPKGRPKFNNNINDNKFKENGNYSNNTNNPKFNGKNDNFTTRNDYRKRNSGQYKQFEGGDGHQRKDFANKTHKSNLFNDNSDSNQDRRQNFKRKFDVPDNSEKKSSEPEKLHPSWAAKKKMSGIQPFQGRKTVFD